MKKILSLMMAVTIVLMSVPFSAMAQPKGTDTITINMCITDQNGITMGNVPIQVADVDLTDYGYDASLQTQSASGITMADALIAAHELVGATQADMSSWLGFMASGYLNLFMGVADGTDSHYLGYSVNNAYVVETPLKKVLQDGDQIHVYSFNFMTTSTAFLDKSQVTVNVGEAVDLTYSTVDFNGNPMFGTAGATVSLLGGSDNATKTDSTLITDQYGKLHFTLYTPGDYTLMVQGYSETAAFVKVHISGTTPDPVTVGVTPDPATASVCFKNAAGVQVMPLGGLYTVPRSMACTYQIEKDGYLPLSGSVTPTANTTLSPTLTAGAEIAFSTTPGGATVVVKDKNEKVVPPVSGKNYLLPLGEAFTYTVSMDGYVTLHDTITPTANATVRPKLTVGPPIVIAPTTAHWGSFLGGKNGLCTANTPTVGQLVWKRQLSFSFFDSVSGQIIADNALIVASGDMLYKLDLQTGQVLASTKMAAASPWGGFGPTFGDNLIFVPLSEGKIQCFDAKTLTSIWLYTGGGDAQGLCPIVYQDGVIYTGFWSSEISSAKYVAIKTADKNASASFEAPTTVWNKTYSGGFYWAGAAILGDTLFVTSDDNSPEGTTANGTLYALNKKTGATLATKQISGDGRSQIATDANNLYFTSKGGMLYKAVFDGAAFTTFESINLGSATTSSPIIAGGRLYVSAKDAGICVIDLASFTLQYNIKTPAYAQGGMLVQAGDNQNQVYFTCNDNPGGIYRLSDDFVSNKGSISTVYTPQQDLQNYCLSSVIAAENGTLYYTNDSGYLFAVAQADESTLETPPQSPDSTQGGGANTGDDSPALPWVALGTSVLVFIIITKRKRDDLA